MAQIVFTIPAAQLGRVLHGLAVTLNVRNSDGTLNETPADVKAALRDWIKNSVRGVEAEEQRSTDGDAFSSGFTPPTVTS